MFDYPVTVTWKRGKDEIFTDKKYSREHMWEFDSGNRVPASPSHHIVPLPHSNPDNIDPEQAFVAALSSCHMLFFLDLASSAGFVVDSYEDEALGILSRVRRNVYAMSRVTLKPKCTYSGPKIPTREELEQLHHKSHEMCYIANSVKTEIITEIIS